MVDTLARGGDAVKVRCSMSGERVASMCLDTELWAGAQEQNRTENERLVDVPLSVDWRVRAEAIRREVPDMKGKKSEELLKQVVEGNKVVGCAGEAVVGRRSWQRVPSLPNRRSSLHWVLDGERA